MSDLRMMVVGVGALGRHHARILAGMDGVQLVAVADPREETGRAIAAEFQTEWFRDYRDAMDGIDAASIVVPTSLHGDVASDFLDRGIPVLVEKPLAGNVDDAAALVDLATASDTLLQVGHIERFNPAMQTAKRLAGLPKYIRSERVSPFPFRSTDIGVVHDLLIHDIDLVLELVRSPLESAQAFGISLMSPLEDVVNARLTFENGCIADMVASRVHPRAKREMQIWSGIGCVDIDFQSRRVVNYAPGESLLFGRSPVELAQQPGADIEQLKQDVFGRFIRVDEPHIPQRDALTAELAEFAGCVRENGRPTCDGRKALEALIVADQVLSAMTSHSWGVSYQLRDAA